MITTGKVAFKELVVPLRNVPLNTVFAFATYSCISKEPCDPVQSTFTQVSSGKNNWQRK